MRVLEELSRSQNEVATWLLGVVGTQGHIYLYCEGRGSPHTQNGAMANKSWGRNWALAQTEEETVF